MAIFARFRAWLAILLVVAGVGGAWIVGARLSPAQAETQLQAGAQVGFVAPDFALPSLAGQAMSLSAQRGNVVLVNFWASWCGPCRSEMPAIASVYARYRDAGFVVLAVNATSQDNESDARSLARNEGFAFPILLDREGRASRTYRLRSLPTSFFVGRDGVIREIVVGAMNAAMLEARVKRLLAGGR